MRYCESPGTLVPGLLCFEGRGGARGLGLVWFDAFGDLPYIGESFAP